MQSLAQEQEDILSAERERLMAEELLAAEQQELNHGSLHSDSESEQDKIAPIATRSPSSGKHLVPARPQSQSLILSMLCLFFCTVPCEDFHLLPLFFLMYPSPSMQKF